MGSSPQTRRQSRDAEGTSETSPAALRAKRVSLFSFLVALPGVIVSGILIWMQPWTVQSKLALILF